MNEKYYLYRFLDADGNILYIGRTNDIERRILKEHFTELGHLPEECYKSIDKIEYAEITNESEEVAYEAILINKLRPKYNVQFKDDGKFSIELPKFEWKRLEIDEYYFKYLKSRKDKTVAFGDFLLGLLSNLDLAQNGNSITTGFEIIDAAVSISGGDLILVASDEGLGKTAFAINVTLHLAQNKKKILYLNLKDSGEEITLRIVSNLTGIPGYKIEKQSLNETEWLVLSQSLRNLFELPIKLGNLSYEEKTINRIIEIIKKDVYDFIIIDELESIHSEEPIYEKDKMKDIMDKLNGLANDIKTPIMVLCQLSSKKIRNRLNKRPYIADLEYDSLKIYPKIIFFLYSDEYYNPDSDKKNILEIIIEKNKLVSTGIVELVFAKENSKYRTLIRD